MTCKDCIHYEACCNWTEEEHGAMEMTTTEQGCNYFKDKSKFIESPCKVGDKIYTICDIFDESTLKCKKIIKPRIIDFVSSFSFLAESEGLIFSEVNFGKTVFLTREEAEKALKERENNGNL